MESVFTDAATDFQHLFATPFEEIGKRWDVGLNLITVAGRAERAAGLAIPVFLKHG
jgi:hypothetical protein